MPTPAARGLEHATHKTQTVWTATLDGVSAVGKNRSSRKRQQRRAKSPQTPKKPPSKPLPASPPKTGHPKPSPVKTKPSPTPKLIPKTVIQPDLSRPSNPWLGIDEAARMTPEQIERALQPAPAFFEAASSAGLADMRQLQAEPRGIRPRQMVRSLLATFAVGPRVASGGLAGLAVGWHLCGVNTLVAAEIDPLAPTGVMVVVIALLLTALGMALPERAMNLIRAIAFKRLRKADRSADHVDHTGHAGRAGRDSPDDRDDDQAWLLAAGGERDAALPWLSLALVGAALGVTSMLWLPVGLSLFGLYDQLLTHFFWTNLTLAALEWATVAMVLAPVCVLAGLLLVTIASTRATMGAADTQARVPHESIWGGTLAGLTAAWFAHGVLAANGITAERESLLAALPWFALAVLATRVSKRVEEQSPPDSEPPTPPELPLAAETLIRGSSAIWGVGAAAAAAGWMHCRDLASGTPAVRGATLILMGLSIGFLIGGWHAARGKDSSGGSGLGVWIAGVGAGLTAILTVRMPAWPGQTVFEAALLTLPIGYALHHVSHSWLARSSSRTLGFAQVGVTILTGTGIGLALSEWWALPALGAMGTLSAGSLVLLATGGLLEIYEEDRPVRTQRFRLALVFGSLAAAIVLYPGNTREWTRRHRGQMAADTFRLAPSLPLLDALGRVRTACLVDTDPSYLPAQLPPRLTHLDVFCSSPMLAAASAGTDGLFRAAAIPASRALRLSHQRYQLVHLTVRPTRGGLHGSSIEFLGRLARRLAPGGMLMVELPVDRLGRIHVAELARTFRHAAGKGAAWTLVNATGARLVFCSNPPPNPSGGNTYTWSPVETLLESDPAARIRSVRRSHTTWTTAEPTTQAIDWLTSLR